MANQGTFPRAYKNSVPEEGGEPIMQYVPFSKMDIGARKSGMPSDTATGKLSLDHVGADATRGGRSNK